MEPRHHRNLALVVDVPRSSRTTLPWRPSAYDSWELAPGDPIGGGRTVVTSLGGGVDYEVFVVEDEHRGRCVAKIARPGLVSRGEACGVLIDEARALQSAAGPGVVRCLDIVLRGDYPHLLLEYVSGPTLRELLRRGHVPSPAAVAALGEALAATLATVAARGWVHLDVKPENIIARPRPTLLDFSISRPAVETERLEGAIGTAAYMAPEQRLAGRPGVRVGAPADVYALAVTLYEAASGQLPAVEAPAPAIPSWLRAILDRALDHAPARRPTAAELALALSQAPCVQAA
jgi:eukaryotic-like serine/threonine-protein kinase